MHIKLPKSILLKKHLYLKYSI